MNDPYQVLGIQRDAKDDEVKKAYRNLSRRYHPDANVNNPNKEMAEEKFKEIQRAYQEVMKIRNGEFAGFGNYGNSYGAYSEKQEEHNYLRSAAAYIRAGYYKEAVNVLSQMTDRTAEGDYYSAVANLSLGNNVIAKEHAQTAVAMNPGNWEYQNLLNRIISGASWYQERSAPFGNMQAGGGDMCTKLCLANILCNLCWGGSGLCCGGYGPGS